MTRRHSYGRAASEQCNATRPVCVTLWPVGPLCPWVPVLPDCILTTPLQYWPSFIWTDPPYQVCQFWLLHTDACSQPPPVLPSLPPPPPLHSPSTMHMSNLSSFLLMHSHTCETSCCGKLCWLNAHGQRREQSWVSRPQIQRVRPRKQTLRRVINKAESPGLVKGHSIQRAFPPGSERWCSHTDIHTRTLSHCQGGFRDCFLWSLYGFTFTTLCLIMQACKILTSPYLINNEWWGDTLSCTQSHNSKYCTYPNNVKNTHFWVIRPLTHVWINSAACQIHTVALWPSTTHSATSIPYLQERERPSAQSKL